MLSGLFTALEPEILDRSGLTAITFKTGPEHVRHENAPPRIIWVPVRDALNFGNLAPGGNPRVLAIRVAGVEAHIWGATYAQAEILLHSTIAALHAKGVGARNLVGVEWFNTAKDVRFGRGVRLDFQALIPVVDITFTMSPEDTAAAVTDHMLPSGEIACQPAA